MLVSAYARADEDGDARPARSDQIALRARTAESNAA